MNKLEYLNKFEELTKENDENINNFLEKEILNETLKKYMKIKEKILICPEIVSMKDMKFYHTWKCKFEAKE